jgi:crotonobetainyl-CoA:carnitine CoA-transferase CaiB-like acyl-CoA transferase
MQRPLSDIRVLELTTAVAGPVAGHALADLGADVLKIEAPFSRPRAPSEFVRAGAEPAARPWDKVPKFNELNRGKRSVVLDVAQPAGREVFLKLAAHGDVVLANFAARVLDRLGIGYDVLREVNPRLIVATITGFGTSGPYRERVTYGPGIDAMSGLASLTGYPGGAPMKAGNHYFDQHAGMSLALAIVAALRQRRLTGRGQRIDLSMLEAGVPVIGEALTAASVGSPVAARAGNTVRYAEPHGVFRCRGDDAWVAIAVLTDAQWRAVGEVLGDAAWAARLAGIEARRVHRDEIHARLAAWAATRTPREAEAALQRLQVPAGAVLKPAEVLADPHLRARGANALVDDPDLGASPVPTLAFRAGFPTLPAAPAPRFGADTAAVLRELAGVDADAYAALQAARVVADVPGRG